MNKQKKRNERRPGFNIGSASIIMVFSVLCLTMFAVLSLVTSNSDMKLTERAVSSVKAYYAAEYEAEGNVLAIKKELDSGSLPGELLRKFSDVGLSHEDGILRFVQPVDERRELSIALTVEKSGELSVSEWLLRSNDQWNPESGVPVWSGFAG